MEFKRNQLIRRLFLNDKFILALILLNATVIFAIGFNQTESDKLVLQIVDNLITGLFIVELAIKLKEFGLKDFFKSNWRIFDFVLVALSIPTFIAFIGNIEVTNFSFLLVFRIMRVFKSFRFLKFIPGIEHIINGVSRALKASVLIIITFVIYTFIIGTLSFYLFQGISSDNFGDPLNSLYSIFKIFTVEGWYEIPEQLTENLSSTPTFFIYLYFIFVVITGGIFGLSLVNSIFVDAMVSDNNDELEKKIESLENKIDKLLTKKI